MDTAYKIYANILNKKLEKERKKETQEKLWKTQFDFKRRKGTMDAL